MLAFNLILFSLVLLVASQQHPARVLLYSATTGYRHDSIPVAIDTLQAHELSINVLFDATEDRRRFNDDELEMFDAMVFLSTTGEVLDEAGQAALQAYLNKGGNFVGIHSAADTLRDTSFFVRQVGSRFDYHPDLQEAAFEVVGPSHPSTEHLPSPWTVRDEIYNFESDPRSLGATVVLAADESSYTDNGQPRFHQGDPHPIAWYQERGAGIEERGIAGRSFYTSLGHLNETWQDPTFISHVLGGIRWALDSKTTRAFNPNGLVGNPAPPVTSSSGSFSPMTRSPTGMQETEGFVASTRTEVPDSESYASCLGFPLVLCAAMVFAATFA